MVGRLIAHDLKVLSLARGHLVSYKAILAPERPLHNLSQPYKLQRMVLKVTAYPKDGSSDDRSMRDVFARQLYEQIASKRVLADTEKLSFEYPPY